MAITNIEIIEGIITAALFTSIFGITRIVYYSVSEAKDDSELRKARVELFLGLLIITTIIGLNITQHWIDQGGLDIVLGIFGILGWSNLLVNGYVHRKIILKRLILTPILVSIILVTMVFVTFVTSTPEKKLRQKSALSFILPIFEKSGKLYFKIVRMVYNEEQEKETDNKKPS